MAETVRRLQAECGFHPQGMKDQESVQFALRELKSLWLEANKPLWLAQVKRTHHGNGQTVADQAAHQRLF